MNNVETTDKAAAVAKQGAQGAPEKAAGKKAARQNKGAPKGQKTAKGGKAKADAPKKKPQIAKKATKPARTKETSKPRAESKRAKIMALIGRLKGATLAEIMKATGWQAHSVRGFLSTATKKHALKIESAKNEGGERIYKIVK